MRRQVRKLQSRQLHRAGDRITVPSHNADALWAVQKWHTSARKISLHRADCLAKINRAGWRG
jgi:hypothetical protein